MAKIKYTSEQRLAIDTKNKNIIVSAQAGAGKTQVLVERILDKIQNEKVDIENLLIVTFTKKAAQEMKDRIKSSLQSLSQDSIEDRKYLNEQFNKVTNAQISTMHSFCINSIRTFFNKIDLNPQFTVLNQATLNILRWDVMDAVFERYYEVNDKDFIAFLDEYSDIKDDENVKTLLFNIYDFIMSQIDPFNWLEAAIAKYDNENFDTKGELIEYKKQQLYSLSRARLESAIKESLKYSEKLVQIFNTGTLSEKHIVIVEETNNLIDQLEELFLNDYFEEMKDVLGDFSFMRMITVPKKFKELPTYDPQNHELFKATRDKFKEAITDVTSILENLDVNEFIKIEQKNKEYINVIYKILLTFHNEFLGRKKDKNGIDFSDAEHFMLELLKHEDVRDTLKERFDYIFFDEYQDANQVQNHIVEMINRDDNLFFVGDIKQSIYKFRLADPSIFNNRYSRYKSGENEKDLAVDLTYNFRSRMEILEFTNFIFDNLMTKDLGEIEYNDPAHRLVPKGNFEPIDNYVPIEIHYIRDKVDNDFKTEDEYIINSDFYEENGQPFLIAKKLQTMINEGRKPKDFAILLRNKAMIPAICEYLQVFDIPFYTDSIDFDYGNLEVLEFINILKAIDNDKRDLILLSALVSVIGNFTEDDIARIRNLGKMESFYNAFYSYEKNDEFDREIADKIVEYKEKIEYYKKIERTMSLYDFSWYLLVDSGYMTYLLSKNAGKEKLDNVVAFIEEIRSYEENANPGLYNFLNYVDRLSNRDLSTIEPGAELSDEDNVVRIMTIHKSKGLQFKNVILANMEKNFNFRDIRSTYILHNNKGVALKLFNQIDGKYKTNIFYDDIADAKKRELLAEEIRLQYVALTRAIDRIIIVGNVSDKNFENIEDDYYNVKNPLSWITSIVLSDEISNGFKFDNNIEYATRTSRLKDLGVKIEFKIHEKIDIVDEMIALNVVAKDEVITPSGEMKDLEFFNFKYPHIQQTTLPFKKTVSELSSYNDNKSLDFKDYENMIKNNYPKNGNELSVIDPQDEVEILENIEYKMAEGYESPKFMKEDEKSATDIGTTTHRILQMLPIRKYDIDSLKAELEKQVYMGNLRSEDLKYVDSESIINLYNSEIGMRILRADRVYKEESFTMVYKEDNNKILVDGQIDLFFIEGDEIVLIDFKTNRRINKSLYAIQFDLYTQGIESALGMKVKERYIYWTRFSQFTEI